MKLSNLELAATYETLMKTPHIDNLILHKLANHVSEIEAELNTLREHRNYASEFITYKARADKYELALNKIALTSSIGDQPFSEICEMFLRIAREALE